MLRTVRVHTQDSTRKEHVGTCTSTSTVPLLYQWWYKYWRVIGYKYVHLKIRLMIHSIQHHDIPWHPLHVHVRTRTRDGSTHARTKSKALSLSLSLSLYEGTTKTFPHRHRHPHAGESSYTEEWIIPPSIIGWRCRMRDGTWRKGMYVFRSLDHFWLYQSTPKRRTMGKWTVVLFDTADLVFSHWEYRTYTRCHALYHNWNSNIRSTRSWGQEAVSKCEGANKKQETCQAYTFYNAWNIRRGRH